MIGTLASDPAMLGTIVILIDEPKYPDREIVCSKGPITHGGVRGTRIKNAYLSHIPEKWHRTAAPTIHGISSNFHFSYNISLCLV